MTSTIIDEHRAWKETNPLRMWRKQTKISFHDASSIIGVGVSTLQQWESGSMSPSDANLARAAEILGMPNLPERHRRWEERNPVRLRRAM